MRLLLLIIIFFSLTLKSQLLKQFDLSSKANGNWKFRKPNEKNWNPAIIPGNVYTDLLNNRIIDDPFIGTNEKKVQWVDSCHWEYQSDFTISNEDLQKFSHAELQLEQIDTYCKVYLNKVLVFETNNFFRFYKKDVKKNLKPGVNELKFLFEPASQKGKELAKKLPYILPGDEKIFTRKPQYHYGWDWGPRLIGCGISGKVELQFWKDVRITDFSFKQNFLSKDSAILVSTTTLEADQKQNFEYYFSCANHPEIIPIKRTILLNKGVNEIKQIIRVKKPKLWWCNGQGSPELYSFKTEIKNNDNPIASASKKIGIRSLKLIRNKDLFGESFYFELNNVPVFIKGANFIPPDNFLARTTDSIFPLIAKNTNMNMLRVWGGGSYASDAFYSQCDELGILAWQDFMFACAMYPGDQQFIKNVSEEIKTQVLRLRNHPSLALWCGNNEITEGWHNWGWQKQFAYSKKDSSFIWDNYKLLFEKKIPDIVHEYSPEAYYWPSSPSIGWGRKESLLFGDSHYWGVWWGMEPFEIYEKKVGRFMSEYGFQGLPALETFKKFCDTNDLNLTSASVNSHQKHPTGFQTIQTYLERDYIIPKNFEKYIYVSQLLQRDGMKMAIEAHRRNKPYCMGTLFWQLNDCWPVTSWSSIDYYKNPKALHYAIPELYNNVSLSSETERGTHHFYILSDTTTSLQGELNVEFISFNGEKRQLKKMNVTVEPGSANKYFSVEEDALVEFGSSSCYFHVTFKSGNIIREYNSFLTSPKKLKLPKPELSFSLNQDKNRLTITSKVFIKDLYLSCTQPEIKFLSNFIDLQANQPYTINLNGNLNSINNIKYISLYNINTESD